MNTNEILNYVDHTQLKAVATWEDIKTLCNEAIEYKTATVCVPPCYVKKIKETYQDTLKICTVIGFPLGYSTTDVKAFETKKAIQDGADEIDMVINITDLKNGDFETIKNEVATLKDVCGDKVLKVIIETCYLTEEEKIKMCEVVTRANADYIKTSTGFGTDGARIEDIKLFKQNIGKNVKIKAAGGIRSVKDMQDFIEEGSERLGTSSAINLVKGNATNSY